MKVLFLDIVHPIIKERLTAAGYACIDATMASKEECQELLTDAHGIVIRSRFKMEKTFLKHAKQLIFIARSGAGMENIDLTYCKQQNIALYNAPDGNRNAVGEHALGMLLALFNKLHLCSNDVKNGKWEREKNRGAELDGKTVGIIGFGNNGSAFAKKLRGFDVTVLAYDKYKTGFATEWVKEVQLESLFDQCDVISFHIPQNTETVYFADETFFSKFRKPIYLINLARGKVVNTAALVNALKSESVLGACLDVLEYEKASFESIFSQKNDPCFDYLLNAENVILSPHVGGWTTESYFKLSNVLADKILKNA